MRCVKYWTKNCMSIKPIIDVLMELGIELKGVE